MDTNDSGRTIPPMGDYEKSDRPWKGGLMATFVSAGNSVKFPLEKVHYQVQVAGCSATVKVTQVYRNEYAEHLEAVYTFPLSGGAAVSNFTMTIGDRVIKGKVKERGKARKEYQEALQSGKQASLVEQEREEIFTMQAGNIPPGESVTVELTYSEKLPFFQEGNTELRLPLVAAPRYIPGAPLLMGSVGTGTAMDSDMVPDASRISPPLLPLGDSGRVDLSIDVEIRQGSGEETVTTMHSTSHCIEVIGDEESVKVGLARSYVPLDRDFVLTWTIAGVESHSTFYTYQDPVKKEIYGMVTLFPPRQKKNACAPRDVVFVIDRSGSMYGLKMTSAARACSLLLGTLNPGDRFAIQAFDDTVEWMPASPASGGGSWLVRADEGGIEKGDRYLRTIDTRGGTEMYGALRDAIDVLARRGISAEGRQPVIVLLTDGQVGNELQLLNYVRSSSMGARIFTVGIDTAVNGGFLQRIALVGKGTSASVQPGADLEEALRAIAREIGQPLVTGIQVFEEDTGLIHDSMAPGIIPDLFVGRPSTFYFRLRNSGPLTVAGRYADGSEFAESLTPCPEGPPAIAHLWARMRAHELEDHYYATMEEKVKRRIVNIAVRHNILTPFTAFVGVDNKVVNGGGPRRREIQPVSLPAGWNPSFGQVFSSGSGISFGGGGGCIQVDLLPTERKKFGFDPIGLLLKLVAFPFYLVTLLIVMVFKFAVPRLNALRVAIKKRIARRKNYRPGVIVSHRHPRPGDKAKHQAMATG